jgi:dephospho-CoA kinase
MAKTLTLAVTGVFGSGKSRVLDYFRQRGAEVVDCDKIARELADGRDPRLLAAIAAKLGGDILTPEGRLDRAKAARLVFRNDQSLKILESLLHPPIMRTLRQRLARSRRPLRVVEAPLLFETGLDRDFDASVAVLASKPRILSRLARAGWSRGLVEARWRRQFGSRIKRSKADFVLDNDGPQARLTRQLRELHTACLSVLEGRKNPEMDKS